MSDRDPKLFILNEGGVASKGIFKKNLKSRNFENSHIRN